MNLNQTRLFILLLPFILITACTPNTITPTFKASETPEQSPLLNAIPDEARIAYGSGGPRSSGYWMLWSSCGENNKADTAEANGGREAGWIILDDLLEQPGITLGVHPVTSCEEGIAILTASNTDPIASLARQLLTAELNLQAGSQYCDAADETVAVSHNILTTYEYKGPDINEPFLALEQIESLESITELLALYNAGILCR